MPMQKELIEKLPAEFERELMGYIEFLSKSRNKKSGRRLKQNWAGGLEEFKDRFTSLELQKKALEWRGD